MAPVRGPFLFQRLRQTPLERCLDPLCLGVVAHGSFDAKERRAAVQLERRELVVERRRLFEPPPDLRVRYAAARASACAIKSPGLESLALTTSRSCRSRGLRNGEQTAWKTALRAPVPFGNPISAR